MDAAIRSATQPRDREGLFVLSFVIGSFALIVAVSAFIISFGDDNGGTAIAEQVSTETEFDIELTEFAVSPATIDVPEGAVITLHVTNNGTLEHDLKVGGSAGTEFLTPGADQTIEIGPFEDNAEAWCTIAGHKAAGMSMKINVVGSDGQPVDRNESGAGGSANGDDGSSFATIDPQAAPQDDWAARDPALPPAQSGRIHELTLSATETVMEVAPGVTQEMWTFNDQVPGPILRGRVGDTFRVTLVNDGKLGHSIDFHASQVAWDDEMRTIQPGESLVYEFTADHAGAWMYHCGTAPALHHIGNGMYGAIIIDPPDLAPVDEEFVFVQSELYLGPPGLPGDLTKMLNEDFDAVVFNGYHNQYVHRPIHVEPDTRYRVWVVDDGPSENSAFHIVGTIFDTVFKEGAYTLQPDDSSGGSQVLDLQPAQGGFVELSFAEDGLYPIVTHKFANTGKGALGFFAVGDADTGALGGH